MPAPIIFGIIALYAGGCGALISGTKDSWQTYKTKKAQKRLREEILKQHEEAIQASQEKINDLGRLELEIVDQFDAYSSLIEKIQRRPEFKPYQPKEVKFINPSLKELTELKLVAGSLLSNIVGMSMGSICAFTTAGVVPSIVAAVGTAGTGTAIKTLSGAAAWNSILASLGGGTIAAGGGGIALGTTILGSLTGGVGILVGGVIVKLISIKVRKNNEKEIDMELTRETVNKLCEHFEEIAALSDRYSKVLLSVKEKYEKQILILSDIVETKKKTDWNDFSPSEQKSVQNTTLLVNLLYNMCSVELAQETVAEDNTRVCKANTEGVEAMIACAESTTKKLSDKPGIFRRLLSKG